MKHFSFVKMNVEFGRVTPGGSFVGVGAKYVLSSFPLGLARISKANDTR